MPRRRWFQFKLSTWFVLIAILAWAMMLRPYYGRTVVSVSTQPTTPSAGDELFLSHEFPGHMGDVDYQKVFSLIKAKYAVPQSRPIRSILVEHRGGVNPSLYYPALALA